MSKKIFLAFLALASLLPHIASARRFGGRRHHGGWFSDNLLGAPLMAGGWDPYFWHRQAMEEAAYPEASDRASRHEGRPLTGMHSRKTENEYIYTINVAGHDEDSISVSTNKNTRDIAISLESYTEDRSENSDNETVSRSFVQESRNMQQSFSVPADADLDQVRASVKNGVLTIRVKRTENADKKGRQKIKFDQN